MHLWPQCTRVFRSKGRGVRLPPRVRPLRFPNNQKDGYVLLSMATGNAFSRPAYPTLRVTGSADCQIDQFNRLVCEPNPKANAA